MHNDNEYAKYLNPEMIEGKVTENEMYFDLVRYLDEMLVKIPDEKDKEMILKNISDYYDSLSTLLIKHTVEHPLMSKP